MNAYGHFPQSQKPQTFQLLPWERSDFPTSPCRTGGPFSFTRSLGTPLAIFISPTTRRMSGLTGKKMRHNKITQPEQTEKKQTRKLKTKKNKENTKRKQTTTKEHLKNAEEHLVFFLVILPVSLFLGWIGFWLCVCFFHFFFQNQLSLFPLAS